MAYKISRAEYDRRIKIARYNALILSALESDDDPNWTPIIVKGYKIFDNNFSKAVELMSDFLGNYDGTEFHPVPQGFVVGALKQIPALLRQSKSILDGLFESGLVE
jgi:hypothetical protein